MDAIKNNYFLKESSKRRRKKEEITKLRRLVLK